MKHIGNIDLDKAGQLLNALMHLFNDDTAAIAAITADGQFGMSETSKRMMYFDGDSIRRVATLSDLVTTGSRIYVSATDPHPSQTVNDGDGWFKPADGTLQIRSSGVWVNASSASGSGLVSFAINTDYENNTVVIHNSQLYRNESGSTINQSTFNASAWVLISGATMTKATLAITPAIAHATTVAGVSRNNNVYTLAHNLGSTSVITKILKNNKFVYTDVEIIDANSVRITLNRPAETSNNTYGVTVAII